MHRVRAAPARGAFSKEAIAVLRDQINNALKDAMKAGDTRRVSTLRLINADILKRETSAAERFRSPTPKSSTSWAK